MNNPNMEQNTALAGKIVYSDGLNVVYNENGYAARNWNPDHRIYEGTTMSVHGQPKEAALKGEAWDKPSVVGLSDWAFGVGDFDKKIENDADFDWRTWGRTDAEFEKLYGESLRDTENGATK